MFANLTSLKVEYIFQWNKNCKKYTKKNLKLDPTKIKLVVYQWLFKFKYIQFWCAALWALRFDFW